MDKQVIVLYPNGEETTLLELPTWRGMQMLVGGFVEQVRVLEPNYTYTYMYVNETGLLDGLPRNQKATEIYQRNVRMQFPGDPNPFKTIRDLERARAEALGAEVFEMPVNIPGFEDDPYIAGTAIYLKGFTCDELNIRWNSLD